MAKHPKMFRAVIAFCLLYLLAGRAIAVERVAINGQVRSGSTAVCAMVLANGQHMFSCGGAGSYNLTVPLDSRGLITLQVFASGFAPFRQVLTVGQAVGFTVNMARDTTGRAFSTTHGTVPASRSRWVIVSGTVNHNGTPVCAMVLANGQNMFSCGASLGRFSLHVPQDSSGNVTLHIFAAGFQPFRTTFAGGAIVNQSIAGVWTGSVNSNVVRDRETLTGIVADTNDAVFFTDSANILDGRINVSGSSVSGTLRAVAGGAPLVTFLDGTTVGSVSIFGTASAKSAMNGSYSGTGDLGTFSLLYSPVNDRGSALSVTSGIWSFDFLGYTITLVVNASGIISGSDTEGCRYQGSISIINTLFNVYKVNATVSSCGAENGNYTGLAFTGDFSRRNDALVAVVSNGRFASVLPVIRQ